MRFPSYGLGLGVNGQIETGRNMLKDAAIKLYSLAKSAPAVFIAGLVVGWVICKIGLF